MCDTKRTGNLRRDIHCLVRRNRTFCHPFTQGGAFNELGRDVVSGVDLSDVVNRDDVRMVQSGSGACFAL